MGERRRPLSVRIAGRTLTVPPVRRRVLAVIRPWVRRSSGRFALPGLLLAAILAIAATAGAVVVPRTAPPPSATGNAASGAAGGDAADGVEDSDGDDRDRQDRDGEDPEGDLDDGEAEPAPSGAPPGASAPDVPGGGTNPGAAAGRPADSLANWATGLTGKVGIPKVALEAYGYAELITGQNSPGCRLSWTTLAGIGKIESDHGRANATLNSDGKAAPAILGAPLDGTEGRDRIPDTDTGRLDGDRTWDRAVGPMQFIPSTWQKYAVDADRDGSADPNDIDDAALAAASYLCVGGRDLSSPAGWWSAVLSYNAVRVYSEDVHRAANEYGQRSR